MGGDPAETKAVPREVTLHAESPQAASVLGGSSVGSGARSSAFLPGPL